MVNELPLNSKEVRKLNLMRYGGVAPSWSLVEKVIEQSGLRMFARFELVYGIPKDTLTWYKNGIQKLSARYWHIFYDFDTVNKAYERVNSSKHSLPKKHKILHFNKEILDDNS